MPRSAEIAATGRQNTQITGGQLAGTVARGTGNFVGMPSRVRRIASVNPAGDITLNFLNADIRDVAKAVLGDYLKVNYIIDNAVQGTISIQTNQPLTRSQVLPALEQALRFNGMALLSENGLYRVVPGAEAPHRGGRVRIDADVSQKSPGFTVEIVPLRYVGAQEMQRVLEPIVPRGAILEVDSARNLLILGGSEEELGAIRDDIEIFDVDWMAGMSFAIYPLKAVDTKTMMSDLNEVMGGRRSPIAGLIRLIPLERMNAILAVSPQAGYLDRIRTWIAELDQATESADQRIYIYYVQNGQASNLASSLTKLLGVGGSSGSARPGPTPSGDHPESAPAPTETPTSSTASSGTIQRATDQPAPTPVQTGSQPNTSPDAGVSTPSSGERDSGVSARGMSGIRITADEANNALLILATPTQYSVIEAALQKLDIVPLQVLLEAAIAEVTLTNELRYGVQYFAKSGNHQIVLTNTHTTAIAPTLPGFAYTFASGSNIQIILDALESVTNVNVVSSPKLLVLNNRTATLQVGDQVPIATQSAVSVISPGAPVVNTIEFRDTGVILKVTPRVNEGGLVTLTITQEVSEVTRTTSSDLNSPTIQQRKVTSSVVVQDGETVALGGLIKDSHNLTRDGIPFLQRIPYLGALFRTDDNTGERTELLVLITPHVVESLEKARSVTEEIRRKMPSTRAVFQRAQ
jgi:general secretion pathway protein D